MKSEIINRVLQTMTGIISMEQMKQLKGALYMAMQGYEVTRTHTEVMRPNRGYEYFLNIYLDRKRTEGKSERTLIQYRLHLARMLQVVNKDIREIGEDDLFCYLTKYKRYRAVSNVYLDNIRLVFSAFFGWLNNKGYIPKNPAAGLEPIKAERRLKKPLSDEELENLRRTCERERDLALIEFLYSTGVRVSELAALNRQDIDFLEKKVVVYGKGSKERETYLTATSCMHLREYLQSRTDDNEALFVSLKAPHQRLTVAGIEDILRKLGQKTGIVKVHPHRFRRTMATNVLKKGMPLEEVKELLGHTKLDTTMIYCTVSRENVKHSHQKYMSA